MSGFMKPEIYFGSYFEIDTTAGTEIVPGYLFTRTVSTHVEAFLDYLEGTPLDMDSTIEPQEGWLGRMSAPGYLDCTAWSAYRTEEEAAASLEEMYGEEFE